MTGSMRDCDSYEHAEGPMMTLNIAVVPLVCGMVCLLCVFRCGTAKKEKL